MNVCSVPGCGPAAKRLRLGMCSSHYLRVRNHGTVDRLRAAERATCSIEGCTAVSNGRGWCKAHYMKWWAYGDPLAERTNKGPRVGDGAGYGTIHMRVVGAKGKAAEHQCVRCGGVAADWAYDHKDPDPVTRPYQGRDLTASLKVEHYQPMCRPCHRRLDSLMRREKVAV